MLNCTAREVHLGTWKPGSLSTECSAVIWRDLQRNPACLHQQWGDTVTPAVFIHIPHSGNVTVEPVVTAKRCVYFRTKATKQEQVLRCVRSRTCIRSGNSHWSLHQEPWNLSHQVSSQNMGGRPHRTAHSLHSSFWETHTLGDTNRSPSCSHTSLHTSVLHVEDERGGRIYSHTE